jgi:hypothetical protein
MYIRYFGFLYTLFIYRRMLQLEEESIRAMCQDIIAVKPDVIVTEKGISGK